MTRQQSAKMFREYPDVLTLAELARMLGISTKLASRMIKDGKIEAVRLGREYRIAKSKVIDFLLCEGGEKSYVLNATSNPKCWTLRNYYDMVVATKEKLETEVS